MSKVLSIEIGYSLIKIIETDFKAKNPKVYRSVNVQTPPGVINDGQLDVTGQLIDAVKGALAAGQMKTKQAVFTITSSKVASREVVVPNVKANKLPALVRANAPDYFPVDINQYEIAYAVLGTTGEDKESMQLRLMVFAAPQSLLEGYASLAEQCGLAVASLDYSGNSIQQVIKNECAEGIQMVIKVDERSSIITIMENGQLSLQRSIPYGVDEAIEALVQSRAYGDMDYKQALDLLRQRTCVNRTLRARADLLAEPDGESEEELDRGEQYALARQRVTEALEPLMGGIARVVDFYNSRNFGKQIERTYLTGMGGDFSGLSRLLTNELGFKIIVLTKAEGFSIGKHLRGVSFGEYIACLGAVVSPLGFSLTRDAAKKSEKKQFELTPVMAFSVLTLCIIISVTWFVIAFLPYREALSDNNYYRGKTEDLSVYVPDYREYTITKQAYGYLINAYGTTQLNTRYAVDFIEELERKMPHNFYIGNLTLNASGFSMSVTVTTKEEAAECIEQLRTFVSIGSLDVNGINDSQEVVIEDFDRDGTYQVLDRDSEIAEALREGAAGRLPGNIQSALQGQVTFSVTGTFSGIWSEAPDGEDAAGGGSGNAGSLSGVSGNAGSPSGVGASPEEDSDEELEAAIEELNRGR